MKVEIMNFFAIAIGGSIGALLRYWVSQIVNNNIVVNSFPIGTLLVNASGCFIGGIIIGGLASKFSSETKSFVVIGILGSYTTFSSFGMETINLIQDDKIKSALIYIASTFILTLTGVILGYIISKKIFN